MFTDGTMERTPIQPGDTVTVIGYGFGARREDCGDVGQVLRLASTRVVVGLPGGVRRIGPACLKVHA